MLVLQQIRAWTKRCLEYWTVDFNDCVTFEENGRAIIKAYDVDSDLRFCQRLIRNQHPHRTDVVQLIDDVLKALRVDHSGLRSDELLYMWYRKRSYLSDQSSLATLDEKRQW